MSSKKTSSTKTDKVLNPLTNRYIKVNSRTYKRLAKEYYVVNGKFVKGGELLKGPNGLQIRKDSIVFNEFLNNKYIYDGLNMELLYPYNQHIYPLDGNPISADWVKQLQGSTGLYIIKNTRQTKLAAVNSALEDTSSVKCIPIELNLNWDNPYELAELTKNINIYMQYAKKRYNTLNDYSLVATSGLNVAFSLAQEGTNNCVIKSCYEILGEKKGINYKKLYNTYKDGVLFKDMDNISQKIQSKIIVHLPNRKELIFGKNRKKHKAVNLYYNNFHVSPYINNKTVEYIEKLNIDNFDIKKICNIIGSFKNPLAIITTEKIYKRRYLNVNNKLVDISKHKEYENAYSSNSIILKNFLKLNNKIKNIKNNHENINAIKSILQHGICYNSSQLTNYMGYDITNAYGSFDKDMYFPTDLNISINTENMKFNEVYDIINNNCGYALVSIECIYEKYGYNNELVNGKKSREKIVKRWMSFPYVKHYITNRKGTLKVDFLLISQNKTKLDMSMFNYDNRRDFHRILGKMCKKEIDNSFITLDPLLAKHSGYCVEVRKNKETNIYICKTTIDKISNNYYPHIVGYIQHNTEIEIEKLILHVINSNNSNNLEQNRITIGKVWCDQVHFNLPHNYIMKYGKELDYKQDKLITSIISNNTDNSFNRYLFDTKYDQSKIINLNKITNAHNYKDINKWKIKWEALNDTVQSLVAYTTPIIPVKYSYTFDDLIQNKGNRIAIIGGAGTGKSYHLKKICKQMSNIAILTPTRELLNNFSNITCYTVDALLSMIKTKNKALNNINTVAIEEFGMVGQKKYDIISDIIDNIIIVGDLAQINVIKDKIIDVNKLEVVNLTVVKRQNNIDFVNKLNKFRFCKNPVNLLNKEFNKKITVEDAIKSNSIIISSTHKEIDRINLIGLDLNNEPINSKFGLKKGSPIRFNKSTKSYNATELGVIIGFKDNKVYIQKNNGKVLELTINNKDYTLAYSVTYHTVQGKTISNSNIVINTNNLFDCHMVYTGLTRAVDEKQIHILDNK